ncbi:14962_t:CDS:2 [Rhizophagus irregularis]|nr:14962_t:CDS:2 [Rhizophagus irregularis]
MLDRLPEEIVERIIAKILNTDLIAASGKIYATIIRNMYWKIRAVRKQYEKDNIDWITFESVIYSYKGWIDCLTKNQLYIMEKMLRNGMVVHPQERETIEYALSEQRWGGDPWGLNWE